MNHTWSLGQGPKWAESWQLKRQYIQQHCCEIGKRDSGNFVVQEKLGCNSMKEWNPPTRNEELDTTRAGQQYPNHSKKWMGPRRNEFLETKKQIISKGLLSRTNVEVLTVHPAKKSASYFHSVAVRYEQISGDQNIEGQRRVQGYEFIVCQSKTPAKPSDQHDQHRQETWKMQHV